MTGSEPVRLPSGTTGCNEDDVVKCEKVFLRWTDLTLTVQAKNRSGGKKNDNKSKKKEIQILSKVSASARSGRILAVMGSSGCGKSTLLDVLSRRKQGATMGTIEFNGKKVFHRISLAAENNPDIAETAYLELLGFVPQSDMFLRNLTCREWLMFVGRLVLPPDLPRPTVATLVDQALERVGLSRVADNRIGDPSDQVRISGGQRRRLTLAQELLSRRDILFIDEATSGLDAAAALSVMYTIRSLADQGICVVMTIHQPRDDVFNMVDDLLLMKAGRVVYFGPKMEMIPYLTSIGISKQPVCQAADFAIDVVTTPDLVFDMLDYADKQRMLRQISGRKNLRQSGVDSVDVLGTAINNEQLIIKIQQRVRMFLSRRRLERERDIRKLYGGYLAHKFSSSVMCHRMEELGDQLSQQHSAHHFRTMPSIESRPATNDIDLEVGLKLHSPRAQDPSAHSDGNDSDLKVARHVDSRMLGPAHESESLVNKSWRSLRRVCRESLILTERTMLNFSREKRFHTLMFVRLLLFSVMIGIVYLRVSMSSDRAYDRVALLFYIINAVSLNQLSKVPFFYAGRTMFERESQGNYYGAFAFQLSSLLVDGFADAVFPIISSAILYPMTNLHPSWSCFFFFVMVLIFFSFTITAMLKLVGSFVTLPIHQALMPVILGVQTIFAGFFIKKQFISDPLIWLNYISVYKYCFEALFYNEFHGLEFDCGGSEFCSPETGNDMIESFDFQDTDKFQNAFILLIFTGGFLVMGYLFLAFFKNRSL